MPDTLLFYEKLLLRFGFGFGFGEFLDSDSDSAESQIHGFGRPLLLIHDLTSISAHLDIFQL